MNHTFPTEDTAKGAVRVWSLARNITVAMLTTDAAASTLSGAYNQMAGTRPLRARFQEHADAIWFIVGRNAVSIDSESANALLTFSNGSDGDHVASRGTLSPSDDRALVKSLWDAHADIAFPQGPDDMDATLLKFQPSVATYWEGGGDFVSFVIDFIGAKMSGEPHDAVKHGTVPA